MFTTGQARLDAISQGFERAGVPQPQDSDAFLLKALLDKTGTPHPQVVVIADDKKYSITAMMETFAGNGTAVHGWRYSREDGNVAALDREQAAADWDAVRPALMKIQEVFGVDNFELGDGNLEGCSED